MLIRMFSSKSKLPTTNQFISVKKVVHTLINYFFKVLLYIGKSDIGISFSVEDPANVE